MSNKGIGVSNLPNLRQKKFIEDGCSLNIMVVGSHGLGKTTFINNLIGNPILSKQPFEEKESKRYWYLEDLCNVQVSRFILRNSKIDIRMTITEIDGVGDHIDNSDVDSNIIDILESNFNDYQNKFKNTVRSLIDDQRIHLCLYFIEPLHKLRDLDLKIMKKISKYSNLIPIIAKADLLNPQEYHSIRKSMKEILEKNSVCVFDNEKLDYEAPFFIAQSSENLQDNTRDYIWGSFIMSKMPYNEINKLYEFIIEKSAINLLNETNHLYDNFRTAQMAIFLMDKEPGASDKEILRIVEAQNREIAEIKERIRSRKAQFDVKSQ